MADEKGFLAALKKLMGPKPKPGQRPSRSTLQTGGLPELPRGAKVTYMKERSVRRTWANQQQDNRRRRLIWIGIGASLLALPVLIIVLVKMLWITTIPQELQGTWRTTEPRYAGRRFELLNDQVVFQVGDSSFTVDRFVVSRVKKNRSARGDLYRVFYDGPDGALYQFAFTFDGSIIRFANQPDFSWTRTGPPSPRPRVGDL